MFEKEAEEYSVGKAHEHYNYLFEEHAGSPVDFARWCFQDGAEFGYNKANEWHYVSKGEYPKKRQLVLGIFQPSEYYTPTELVFYEKELDCWSNQMGDSEYHNIYAWKEIELPELPKEK